MELLHMRPEQIREAVTRGTPLLIPVGSMEYHGEHLPIGTDTIICEGICRRIADMCDVILLPPLPLTPTMNWAGGAADGDIDFSADALEGYARELFIHLADMGFRDFYAMIGHAGALGMPATVLRKVGLALTARLAKGALGAGWGALPDSAMPAPDIFELIKIVGYDDRIDYEALDRSERMPVEHAGKGETQLVRALRGQAVRMDALLKMAKPLPPWLEDAHLADDADGAFWIEACANAWVKYFKRKGEERI